MNSRYDWTVSLAKKAGEKILSAKDKHVEISAKDGDPRNVLTNVDLEVGDFITDEIRRNFPGEAVYSEEMADGDLLSGSFWSVDPIDGTANFSCNIPHYATVVAYVEKGVPIVGAIYNPVTDELFSFEKGRGAFLNDRAIRVSSVKELEKAAIFITASRRSENWDWITRLYRFLLERAHKIRVMASSALDLCFVAAGRTEACIYPTLTTVDIIAAVGLLKEAGGIIEGLSGPLEPLSRAPQRVIAANNRDILGEVKKGV